MDSQDGERPPGLVSLGRDLTARAPEIGRLVRERCAALLDPYPTGARERIGEDIVRRCTLATTTTGHYIETGETATPAEWQLFAAAGKASADARISLADMTKLYLAWRDLTIEAVRHHAARAAVDDKSLHVAEDAIRIGCDASLVRTAKQFDTRRSQLHAELSEERARLAHLARHDVLTGLPNRRSLFEELGHVVDACTARRLAAAVLFVDLDDFKAVNDRAGHSTGDRLLSEVAERLARVIRPGDMVARFGGDEFVILCCGLREPVEESARVASRIHVALADPFVINGVEHRVAASIGTSVVGPDDNPERLLSAADAAMYTVKHSGRTSVRA